MELAVERTVTLPVNSGEQATEKPRKKEGDGYQRTSKVKAKKGMTKRLCYQCRYVQEKVRNICKPPLMINMLTEPDKEKEGV